MEKIKGQKIKDVKYDDIKSILSKYYDHKEESDEIDWEGIYRHFSGVNLEVELELTRMFGNGFTEESFKYFQEKNPDLIFDTEPSFDYTPVQSWEMPLLILEMLYKQGKEQGVMEVVEAKELNILRGYKDHALKVYAVERKLFIDKNEEISKNLIMELEKNLDALGVPEGKKLCSYIFKLHKEQIITNIFIDHFSTRIRILKEDKALTNKANQEFKKFLDKNIIEQ